ncbi:hypothetical protein PS15p_212267 [Mucor circinelloides]
MVTTRSKGISNQGASTSSSRAPSTTTSSTTSWVMVAKRNKGKQRHVPFSPTIVQPSVAISASSQALSSDSRPSSVELVRPFIKGLERNSVLIDITHIKDIALLEERLKQFNNADNQTDIYNDFIGYPETIRTYLGHRFLETMWVHHSAGHNTILNDGVFLSDGTYVKGFESYPTDAKIVHVKLENLPFLPARLVMQDMKRILSFYGEVLDLGITQVNGIFHGKGYATLNQTKPRTVENVCLSTDHPHGTSSSKCDGYHKYQELTRVIPWEEDDGYYRHVLAQWDSMPEFCRICQQPGHCRADCPEYKKHITCHHCNLHGHIARNCPRLNDANKVRIVEKPAEKKPTSNTRTSNKGKGRDTSSTSSKGVGSRLEQAVVTPRDADTKMSERTLAVPPSAASGPEQAMQRSTDSDTLMYETQTSLPKDTIVANSSVAVILTPFSPIRNGEHESFVNKPNPPGSPTTVTGDAPPTTGITPGSTLTNALPSSSVGKELTRQSSFDEDSPLIKTHKTSLDGDVSVSRKLTAEEHRQEMDARARDLALKISEASTNNSNNL